MNTLELNINSTNTLDKRKLKQQKLIQLANSVLKNPQYKEHFDHLLSALNITHQAAIGSFLEYNLDSIFDLPGNRIYSTIGSRVTFHIHNLLEGSWHIERQKTVWEFIKNLSVINLADIGFGVPSLYVQKILSKKNKMKVTLCDLYPSAFDFSKALLPLWNDNWLNKISFIKTDMDELDFIGPFDLYIFLDSIEHTLDPTQYLKKYTSLSPQKSLFLFSIPIGPIIPGHYLSWKSDEEAKMWLNYCGLNIVACKNVYVNLDVDLFARDLGAEFHNYMVLCKKY